jgi:hypothetical protein
MAGIYETKKQEDLSFHQISLKLDDYVCGRSFFVLAVPGIKKYFSGKHENVIV